MIDNIWKIVYNYSKRKGIFGEVFMMRHITKRVYALLLCVLSAFGMAVSVCAGDQGVTGGNFTVWIIVGIILVALIIALTVVQKIRKNGKDE